MNYLISFLRNLRILDEDGSLSLTSVALLIVLYKVAMTPSLSLSDVGLFLGAVSMYSGKKYLRNQATSTETTDQLDALNKSVQLLHDQHAELKNKTVLLDNRTTALLTNGRMK